VQTTFLQIVDRLIRKEVRLVAIKESLRLEGQQNLQTKAMIALFGLFAEVERDLIAERRRRSHDPRKLYPHRQAAAFQTPAGARSLKPNSSACRTL